MHDSLRDNGAFNKIINEDTVTICSYGKDKKVPWKTFLTVSKLGRLQFYLIFFYLQIGDAANLVKYIGFILNFRRDCYRENGLASGNFKVSN